MSLDLFGEPQRDQTIGDVLGGRVPVASHATDDELRARILRAARPELARLARGRPWWEWTAAWGRVAVPVGLAASLVAGALLARTGTGTAAGETESSVILGAATGATGGSELGDQFVAQANGSWLLTQALGQ